MLVPCGPTRPSEAHYNTHELRKVHPNRPFIMIIGYDHTSTNPMSRRTTVRLLWVRKTVHGAVQHTGAKHAKAEDTCSMPVLPKQVVQKPTTERINAIRSIQIGHLRNDHRT